MNFERQYITCVYSPQSMPVMNKNQTLLAYYSCIFSMEDGMLILNENCEYYFYNTVKPRYTELAVQEQKFGI
jgi:hypothetical protein